MAAVYAVNNDGSSSEMARIHIQNEDADLQRLLEKNYDLLPGDQIDPESPRRWLLIKREMPVPDPGTGQPRWSVDFLFVDQDAVPTFVECKRFSDTRARREVIGQMIEYAANGHRYWDKKALRNVADQTAKSNGFELVDALSKLGGPDCDSPDEFFNHIEQNLREGQLRIVFFLEDSPIELRSLVEFLNKQMERSEVLLVEARQFRLEGKHIVVPTLFGYTEEARQIKRPSVAVAAAARHRWDENSFFADAQARINGKVAQLRDLYDQLKAEGFGLDWGNGQKTGTFNVRLHHSITPRALITVYSTGGLQVNLILLPDPFPDRLKSIVEKDLGLSIPLGQKYPSFPINEWGDKIDALVKGLLSIAEEFGPPEDSATH